MTVITWRRIALIGLWLPIVTYAVRLTRGFFRHADAAIYLSTDDAVANISYALAEAGRYGFLSSPVLQDLPRYQGLFSYGPYYFYLGAALIWLFGYSLTALRAIHLGIILLIAFAAGRWFDRGWAGAAGGALAAVGLLVAFERAHWPMVRPDIMVSFFAVMLVLCAGAAMLTRRAWYWVGAGFGAACGALSHLVSWSLVPAAVLILFVHLVSTVRAEGRAGLARAWRPLLALAAGGIAGAFVFYESFDFRFADQYLFLTGYQEITGSMGALAQPAAAFTDLLSRHFVAAYWYLPYPLEYLVWATGVAGVAVTIAALRGGKPWHGAALALVAPPLVVWFAYLLSLGVFNNFHSGYAMLNQVMWIWTGGALITVVPSAFDRWPLVRRTLVGGAWAAALVLGWGVITVFAQRTDYRGLQAASYTPIDAYVSEVLAPIPSRAVSWGSVIFGIEHPNRLQLVQFAEAIEVAERHDAASRAALAPDYVVWGNYENRYHTLEVIAGETNPFNVRLLPRMAAAFPGTHYQLVSMTAGVPYGVTRVYARKGGLPAGFDQPMVSVHDAKGRRWNRAAGATMAPGPLAVEPAQMHVGPESRSRPHTAVQTMRVDLPAGAYLLRIGVSNALTSQDAVAIVAGPSAELRDAFEELGPGFDVSPWLPGETAVHLLYAHPGGPAFISQFGAAPAITTVDARPILSLPDFSEARRPAAPEQPIPANQWQASFPEITVTPATDGASVAVLGNRVQYGYQVYGPKIPVKPGMKVRLRVPVTVSAGSACLGVLDGTGMRWLVAPDRLSAEYEFAVTEGETVMPVLANCSGFPNDVVPIQAVIAPSGFAVWLEQNELYIDQLMRGFIPGPVTRP